MSPLYSLYLDSALKWIVFFYFQLPTHIYGACYREWVILLDLKQNQYLSLEKEAKEGLVLALSYRFKQEGSTYLIAHSLSDHPFFKKIEVLDQLVKMFIEQNVLEITHWEVRKNYLGNAQYPVGLSQIEWKPRLNVTSEVPFWLIIEAFFELVKIHFILKVGKISKLIRFLQRRLAIESNTTVSLEQISLLGAALDKVCLFYPKKTYCLPWAGTLALLAFKRGWKCQFFIGIQTLPFYAHAWIEYQGKIVNDSLEIQERLAPILTVPAQL